MYVGNHWQINQSINRDGVEVSSDLLLPLARYFFGFLTRWEKENTGLVRLDIEHGGTYNMSSHKEIQLTISRLANINRNGVQKCQAGNDHILNCRFFDVDSSYMVYTCDLKTILKLRAFEISSMFLFNLRKPHNSTSEEQFHLFNMVLTIRQPTFGLIDTLLELRVILCPLVIVLCICLRRNCLLASALFVLNLPLEYPGLNVKHLRMLFALREWMFLFMLLHFWQILAGKRRTKWLALLAGCLILFGLDMVELVVPMYFLSNWFFQYACLLALGHFILTTIFSIIYFVSLCLTIRKGHKNLGNKDSSGRLSFKMAITLLCSFITMLDLVMGQVVENLWKWNCKIKLQLNPMQAICVYGMWNFYMVAFLMYNK